MGANQFEPARLEDGIDLFGAFTTTTDKQQLLVENTYHVRSFHLNMGQLFVILTGGLGKSLSVFLHRKLRKNVVSTYWSSVSLLF